MDQKSKWKSLKEQSLEEKLQVDMLAMHIVALDLDHTEEEDPFHLTLIQVVVEDIIGFKLINISSRRRHYKRRSISKSASRSPSLSHRRRRR